MQKRQESIISGTFLVSAVFFFLVSGLFVNYLLGMFFVNLEDTLVSDIERETHLKIGYDSLRIRSFNTLVIQGISVRHPEEARGAPLASVERAELSVRPLAMLFGSKALAESISAVRLEKPELNFYSDTSLISAISSITQEAKIEEALPPLLNCDLTIDQGRARFYTEDSFRQSIPTAPLAMLSLSNGEISIKNNKGSFRIQSDISVLPDQGFAKADLNLSGSFDIDSSSLNALIAFSDMVVSGVRLPDLRFQIQHENESFKLDSSSFWQAVNIDGQYQAGENGKFVLTLDEKNDVLDRFILQDTQGTLGQLFFSGSETYSPSGRMVLDFAGQNFTVASDFAIRDSKGSDVFRLQAHGDERQLAVERAELSRGDHFLSVSANWDWHSMPRARAIVRGLDVGSVVFDGDLSLEPGTGSSLQLMASAVRINGAPFGNFHIDYDTSSSDFSLTGFSGSLSGLGKTADGTREIALTLNNLNLGTLLAGITQSDTFAAWYGSGNARVIQNESGIEASGALAVAIPDIGIVNTELSIDNEGIIIRKFSLGDANIHGNGRFVPDGMQGDFVLDLGSRSYPLSITYRDIEGTRRISADIPDTLHIQAMLSRQDMYASFLLHDVDLAPLGLDARASGEGTLSMQEKLLASGGNISLEFNRPHLKFELDFKGQDTQFEISQLVCSLEGRSLQGSGSLQLNEGGRWETSLSFANGIQAVGYLEGKVYGGTLVFNNVDAGSIAPELVSGILRGHVDIRSGNFFPALAWSLDLSNGKIMDIPVQLHTEAKSRASGFDSLVLYVQSGIADITAENGWLIPTSNGYEVLLAAFVSWKGVPFPVQGQLRVQGMLYDAGSDLLFTFMQTKPHLRVKEAFTARMIFSDGHLALHNPGRFGLVGEVDTRKKFANLKYNNPDGAVITLRGGYNYQLSLTGQCLSVPLVYLENFPTLVRSAKGTANLDYRVDGTIDSPVFSAALAIDGAELDIKPFRTPLSALNLHARFTNNMIFLDDFSAANGSGALYINGQAVVRNGEIEDIDARVRTDRKVGIDVHVDETDFKTTGGILADLFISGSAHTPQIQGRIAMHDNEFYFMDSESDGETKDNILNRIKWNLEINALERVSYVHPLTTLMLQPGSGILLRNSVLDRDFDVSGLCTAARGTFDYINYEFRIEAPTYLEFRKTARGVDPWLTFRGRLRLKDEDNEDMDVFLTFSGSLAGGINPVFSSEPERSQHDIRIMLGLDPSDTQYLESERGSDNLIFRSADLLSTILLKPIEKEIRQFLGLDIFTVRTPLVRNILERESSMLSDEGKKLSVFRDSRLSVGKYIFSFLFIEGSAVLKDRNDPVNTGTLVPMFEVGAEVTYDSVNFGYAYKAAETSTETKYEHGVQIRFRQRF